MTSANISHRLLALVLLVSAAPIVPGLSDSSAGAPLGSAPPRIERQVALGSGPAGDLPVVERHVSGDSVVDWLEEPPADAAAALAEPAAPGRPLGDVEPGAAASEAGPSSAPAADPAPHAVPAHQVEAANGGSSSSSSAPGQGFSVFSTSPRWIPTGYSIRLTGADARVEQLRDELEAAAAAAETATGTRVRVAAGRGGAEQPSRGEITVVVGSGPCGGGAIGCGGPAMTSSEIVSGRIWIYPNGLSLSSADRRHLAAHELGHALGLQHYSGVWEGARQTMYPTTQGITSFRSGDVGGLRYMAGLHDRPAGTVTGRSYVAGQMRVTGSVTSGSKVRVTVGSATQDVTVSGGGFTAAVPAPAGSHQVCALVLDAASGFRRNLGCATVSAPGAPFGNLESVSGSFESIVVSGWAIDPQTADSVKVEVRRGSTLLATSPADAPRPDVGGAYSGYGDGHGFRVEVPAVAGANTVCVRVLGVGAGGDVDLGCRKVVHAVQPVGAFELAVGGP